MARPTQAHLPRKIKKSLGGLPFSVKRDMEYYMGAKLIEVGVNPKSAIYRWSAKAEGDYEVWTYSAYWADSKDQILQEEQKKGSRKK
jgi:hypothetical protein